jgi:uncharacterized protein YifN (PemK superfamily)
MPYHKLISLPIEPPAPFEGKEKWVKGDLIYTFAFHRLTCPNRKNPQTGKRDYVQIILTNIDMNAVEQCIKKGLGM